MLSLRRLYRLLLLAVLVGSCNVPVTEKGILFPSRASLPPDDSLTSGVVTGSSIEIPVEATVKLRGVHLKYPGSSKLILYSYGNAEYVAEILPLLDSISHAFQADVVSIDYRGYGFSDGTPTLASLRDDAPKVFDRVATDAGKGKQIILIGRSIGSAFALAIAAQREAAALVLISPPSSIPDLVSGWNRLLPWYQRLVFNIKASDELLAFSPQPIDNARQVTENTLVIHGEEDAMVPIELGRRLFDALISKNKRWIQIKGGTHQGIRFFSDSLKSAIESL